jgi:hypothetical protein
MRFEPVLARDPNGFFRLGKVFGLKHGRLRVRPLRIRAIANSFGYSVGVRADFQTAIQKQWLQVLV